MGSITETHDSAASASWLRSPHLVAIAIRRLLDWGPLIALPAAVILLAPSSWPRWTFMWALAVAIYACCKWLTWRAVPVSAASVWLHVAYLLAWPGLDAAAFLQRPSPSALRKPAIGEWLF